MVHPRLVALSDCLASVPSSPVTDSLFGFGFIVWFWFHCLVSVSVLQVPRHVGVCHAQLMHDLSVYVANVRRGEAGCTPGTPLRLVKSAARDLAQGTVTLYQKCELKTSAGRVKYWAVPEYRHHDDHQRARFDFVEEWAELWAWSDNRKPCRPVVQLRGFVQVELEGGEDYNVAIGQNLKPHDEAIIDDSGNPRHPKFTVLHCLWRLQRCVLPRLLTAACCLHLVSVSPVAVSLV